jgi:hypothetical protein
VGVIFCLAHLLGSIYVSTPVSVIILITIMLFFHYVDGICTHMADG